MITADSRVRVYARAVPTDMRKSYDTLAALVTQGFAWAPSAAGRGAHGDDFR